MATLLFMMLPEKGHLNASLKIAKALKARGHRVVYTSLSDFEDYLVSQGLEFIPLFQPVAPKGFITDCQVSVSPLDAVTKLLYLKGLKEKRTAHEYLEEEINRIREQAWPDSIILDAYLALRIARLVARLTTPCLLLNPTVRFPVDLNIPDHNSPAFDRLLELPTLFLCPEEFDLPGSQRANHHYYVEASVDLLRQDGEFAWDGINNEKQLIYCSLGTQSQWSFAHEVNAANQHVRLTFLRQVIKAVASRSDWQLVLTTGNHLRAEDFGSVPPNVLLASYVPQLEIIKRASVVITHGGLNTIKECILLGAPMIVFPMEGDQIGNAARVAYHHLGISGRLESATAVGIRAMIDRIHNHPLYRRSIARMSQIFKHREESEQAVALIESQLVRQSAAGP